MLVIDPAMLTAFAALITSVSALIWALHRRA